MHVMSVCSSPVLVAPELLLKVPAVGHLIPEGGLALHPVHHLPIYGNRHLESEVGSLVVATGP